MPCLIPALVTTIGRWLKTTDGHEVARLMNARGT
jgi:hypothetical protein